jgi:hypothetical protein
MFFQGANMFKRFKKWLIKWASDEQVGIDPKELLLPDATQYPPMPQVVAPAKNVGTDTINTYSVPEHDNTEPWVNITSSSYDPVKGFRIELDWNDAFIQHLKEGGIKGRTEDEVVQKWLGLLYGDIMEKLEFSNLENSDRIRINDFV